MNLLEKGINLTLGEFYNKLKNFLGERNLTVQLEAYCIYGDLFKPNINITDKLPEYLYDRKLVSYCSDLSPMWDYIEKIYIAYE